MKTVSGQVSDQDFAVTKSESIQKLPHSKSLSPEQREANKSQATPQKLPWGDKK